MDIVQNGVRIAVPSLKKLDQASATTLYIGEALPGSGDAWNSWQIKRVTFDESGNPTAIAYAEGGSNILLWSQRASYTYG